MAELPAHRRLWALPGSALLKRRIRGIAHLLAVYSADQSAFRNALSRQRRPSIHKQVLWIRRPWPLQFMAANGRRQNRRQQVRAGSACRPPKGPGELAMPVLCLRCVAPAAASGTGPCPALTLSNAVPWFGSEVDTFLSNQLLVVGRRLGASN